MDIATAQRKTGSIVLVPLTISQVFNYGDQALAESVAWHQNKNPKLTPKDIDNYRAGFQQGIREALKILSARGNVHLQTR
jgi:hypothetical protein